LHETNVLPAGVHGGYHPNAPLVFKKFKVKLV